jgi:hypothetical protein
MEKRIIFNGIRNRITNRIDDNFVSAYFVGLKPNLAGKGINAICLINKFNGIFVVVCGANRNPFSTDENFRGYAIRLERFHSFLIPAYTEYTKIFKARPQKDALVKRIPN